jgi:hypothetical protein
MTINEKGQELGWNSGYHGRCALSVRSFLAVVFCPCPVDCSWGFSARSDYAPGGRGAGVVGVGDSVGVGVPNPNARMC